MFCKLPPDEAGGGRFDNITWDKLYCEYDVITWETAQQLARESVLEYDETCTMERNVDAAEVLGAAGRFADKHTDAHDDP
jgi:hypothetical protein